MTSPTDQILHRVQDAELDLSNFPGGSMDRPARELPDEELVGLVDHLDYLSRGEPDANMRWRYNSTIRFLREVAKRREVVASDQEIQNLAAEARRTGRETCRCGAPHKTGANYYVSVHDSGKTVLISGPYHTHAESLGALPAARKKAMRVDPQSHFYSFGTVATSKKQPKRGALDPL